MKIANLWLFFYNTGTAVPRVVTVEDSRSRRFHAHAEVNSVAARRQVGLITVRADAVAPVRGIQRQARVGVVYAMAASHRLLNSLTRQRAAGHLQLVNASSSHQQAPTVPRGRATTRVRSRADAYAPVNGVSASRAVGQAQVVIGPDLIEEELDELLLLMEVA